MRPPSLLRRLMPSHTANPLHALASAWSSGNPAGRAAVVRSGAGLLAAPLDLAMSALDRRLTRTASEPALPIVFVCGPARSGTSLVAQTLIRQFPVAYFSNLFELFPRSPLTVSRWLARTDRRRELRLASFYGKTAGLHEPSDAMALWDRWLGPDRNRVPSNFDAATTASMRRFFGAWEALWNRPTVAKYNRLYVCGAQVAEALPRALFVCLERDAVFLAQSQLQARRLIVGDEHQPYGTVTPDYQALRRPGRPAADAVAYVAADRQVVARTRERIGRERFWIVSYEQFCRDPNLLLERLSREVLDLPFEPLTSAETASIRVSRRQALDDASFSEIRAACAEFELSEGNREYFV